MSISIINKEEVLENKLDEISESANNYTMQMNAIKSIINTMWFANCELSPDKISLEIWNEICNTLYGVLSLFNYAETEKERLSDLIIEAISMNRQPKIER